MLNAASSCDSEVGPFVCADVAYILFVGKRLCLGCSSVRGEHIQ